METSSNKASLYRKTIFLDSNYIIYLSLFIKLCATVGREPSDSFILNSKTLAKCGINKSKLEMDRLKDGKKLFDYLVKEVQQDPEIITSRFCELEFLHLLLEKQAHENLLRAGVPFRLRSHKHEELYLTSLEQTDYAKVADEYEQLKDKLSEYGIEPKILEKIGDYQGQIIETAKIVIGNIIIAAPDAIVYASAITAEADEFLSTDTALAKIINHIRNPSTERWKSIASSFIQKLIEQNVSLEEVSDLKLPAAKKLRMVNGGP